jgi:alpha-tubulin suppressor-like RCC1 family protein
MFAWGLGAHGQTGLGSKEEQTRPAALASTVENVVYVATAPRFNIALTSDGDLYSWGTGLMGELGLAYITYQEKPTKITKVQSKFKAIAIGYEHSLALSEGGDIYVWGANDLGQLGTGDLKPIDRPTKLKSGHKYIALAAGTKHSMALTEHGFIHIWGGGWAGQMGDSESKSFLTPHLLSEDLTFKFISAGDNCSLAINSASFLLHHHDLSIVHTDFHLFHSGITDRGKVYTWGSGSHGRLGHGDVKPQLAPKVIEHLTKMNVTAVKVLAGFDHMLLLSDKGELWTWGAGANGETAQNTTVRRMIPHPVLFYTPSTTSDLPNGHGPVSETSTEGEEKPVPVAALPVDPVNHGPFVDIGIGRNFSVAINSKGECYTWGNPRNGVLGNGLKEGLVFTATKIDSDVKFSKVFVSRDHVIALGEGQGAPVDQAPVVIPNPEEPVATSSNSVN